MQIDAGKITACSDR